MKLRQYQIDAFAHRVFEGNPAAVCPLEAWPDDGLLQAIAEENNLSETAFFVPSRAGFQLRWFTPLREVELCGHATLASAYVVFELLGYSSDTVVFETLSGPLSVARRKGMFVMDFPAHPPVPCTAPAALVEGLGLAPVEVLAADDYLAVYQTEAEIRRLTPDLARLARLDRRGVVVTAPGDTRDFVCRVFAPNYGIPEDPVTGSAFTELAPYWQARLGKSAFTARQVSKRGGEVQCELKGRRVEIAGRAVKFMEAEIEV